MTCIQHDSAGSAGSSRFGLLAGVAEAAREMSWADKALCAETDPEAFFPEKGGSTREAKRVCRSCEVRAECLEYALTHDERFGIYGGTSERERRRLKSRFGGDITAAVASVIDGTGRAA